MKVLIAYASLYGDGEFCAERIKNQCSFEVDCVNLTKQSVNPSSYDIVVLGTSITYAKPPKAFRNFLETNREVIKNKKHAFFLLCGRADEEEHYRYKFFPSDLTSTAFANIYFGGTLKKEGKPLWHRLVIKHMRSKIMESEIDDGHYTPVLPTLLPENIDAMASAIKNEITKNSF